MRRMGSPPGSERGTICSPTGLEAPVCNPGIGVDGDKPFSIVSINRTQTVYDGCGVRSIRLLSTGIVRPAPASVLDSPTVTLSDFITPSFHRRSNVLLSVAGSIRNQRLRRNHINLNTISIPISEPVPRFIEMRNNAIPPRYIVLTKST